MTEEPTRKRHRHRVVKVIAALAVAWLVADKVITVAAPDPQAGSWRSQAGFEAYKSAYDDAMATMPAPTRIHDVRTEFGIVRVYEWAADEDAADPEQGQPEQGQPEQGQEALPVVLLPGIRSGVPMWAENLPHWAGARTIYAMDGLGDAGLSTHSVPFESFDHQMNWLEQTLAGLDLEQVHMVGHSFGGAGAATHALHHPGRVASLTLYEPVLVLAGLPASMYLWSSMLLLPAPQSWKDRALAEIGGVTVEEVQERTPVSVMIDEGSKHYNSVQLTPRTLTDSEWQSMEMPIRVEIASDKSLAGGQEAADRAQSLGLDQVVVRPNTTHSLPMQAAEELGTEMEQYWTAHDPPR